MKKIYENVETDVVYIGPDAVHCASVMANNSSNIIEGGDMQIVEW